MRLNRAAGRTRKLFKSSSICLLAQISKILSHHYQSISHSSATGTSERFPSTFRERLHVQGCRGRGDRRANLMRNGTGFAVCEL